MAPLQQTTKFTSAKFKKRNMSANIVNQAEVVHLQIQLTFLVSSNIKFQPQSNSRGEGYLVSLAKGLMSVVCQHFQRATPLKLLDKFEFNFICSLLANRESKFIYFVQVT